MLGFWQVNNTKLRNENLSENLQNNTRRNNDEHFYKKDPSRMPVQSLDIAIYGPHQWMCTYMCSYMRVI